MGGYPDLPDDTMKDAVGCIQRTAKASCRRRWIAAPAIDRAHTLLEKLGP
jgi:hypothetical protein